MTPQELLAAYQSGTRDFRYAYFGGANLGDVYLVGADLRGANFRDSYLVGAYLVSADLRGADLRDADLSGADLRSADLAGAQLAGAQIAGANLSGANLSGADLSGANLRNVDFGESCWIIQGPSRSDGYGFSYVQLKLKGDKHARVLAGCRNFTMQEAREHWQKTRAGTPLGAETFAILDCLEALAKARGLEV